MLALEGYSTDTLKMNMHKEEKKLFLDSHSIYFIFVNPLRDWFPALDKWLCQVSL